jgi:hypothetical protein
VGSSAKILLNGTLILGNGTRIYTPPCKSTTQLPSLSGGWVEWAWSYYKYGTNNFDGNWNVPNNPSSPNDGQLLYLWLGLECCGAGQYGGQNLMQPVLQWGSNGLFGGTYWTMASWYVATGNYYHSSPINVNAGNGLYGGVDWVYNPNLNEYGWQVTSQGNSHSSNLFIGTLSGSANTQTSAYVNFEAYNIKSCADYPNSPSTTFSNLYLDFYPVWFTFTEDTHNCNEMVTVNSISSITLSY